MNQVPVNTLTLILGGARSGKTSYAQEQARQIGGNVLYVATAANYFAPKQSPAIGGEAHEIGGKGIKGRKQIAAPLAPLDPLAHQSGGSWDRR